MSCGRLGDAPGHRCKVGCKVGVLGCGSTYFIPGGAALVVTQPRRLIAVPRLRARPRRGQALTEFALVLPLLIVLFAMALDFGRVFYGWVSINNAARVGAAYAAANADAWETPSDPARQARYAALVENDLQDLNCTLSGVPEPDFTDADTDGDGSYDTGGPVEVALECAFELLTPLGTSIVGTVDLGGSATFPVHHTIQTSLPSPPAPPPPPTCTVPGTVGQSRNTARALWDDASFQPGNLIENGSGNFTVATQSVPANTQLECTTGSMTIAPAAGPTPTPAPTCQRPSANFTGTPTSGTTSITVQFTDQSTTTAGCPILTWSWDFDNGSSTLEDPSQVFTHAGQGNRTRYDVSLTVTNSAGSDTETKNNYITVNRP